MPKLILIYAMNSTNFVIVSGNQIELYKNIIVIMGGADAVLFLELTYMLVAA